MMELFEHNEKAYNNSLLTLEKSGKAVVIHPTGTGKSFIGFKLCEDFPKHRICWLSPSEYIYKTQIENWEKAGGGKLDNIEFFTYAKLMLLDEAQLQKINPDYIILDEFHRAGARMWGHGVDRLLSIYNNAKILGLSATHIRYLDNQRDMAQEIFDGNIASEMSLGEAIVRGILPEPKYVTALFSYKEEFIKYENRIKKQKSKATRDESEKYLEALRRTLENAEGLEDIFEKHIKNKNSKFIVFCANKEHLDEMWENSKLWFSKVDPKVNRYIAYSDDPETDKNFKKFKEDNSEHLKLLFCIDMLNEGVHVDDITGVILLRPTVSPIVYKQQIGRALSSSKKESPVIFDIVNNFENLYSIGTIEDEMKQVVVFFKENGESEKIVTENFTVFEEVKNARKLFDELNESLTASWDLMYNCAKNYYENYGNLDVQKRYKTAEGYSLGSWIITQRRVKKGEIYGNLSEDRIKKLDEIGMCWDNFLEISFNKNYKLAKKYFTENGNLDIYNDYIAEDTTKLGAWICNLRQQCLSGRLSEIRINSLNEIGMIWDKMSYLWEQGYSSALNYYLKHGDLEVKSNYVDENSYKLGAWISSQKTAKKQNKLDEIQIERLEKLGIIWVTKHEQKWNKGFEEAKKYYEKNGNLDVRFDYVMESGFELGSWIQNQRNKVTTERRKKLDEIGMIWSKNSWESKYQIAKKFYEENNHLNVPSSLIVNGVWLNKWINEQKQRYHGNRKGKDLSEEEVILLEQIGIDWRNSKEIIWDKRYAEIEEVYKLKGDLNDCDKTLKRWFRDQKKACFENKLNAEQVEKVEALITRKINSATRKINIQTIEINELR